MRGAHAAPGGAAAGDCRPGAARAETAALVLFALDVFVVVFCFASFAEEVCEERATRPPVSPHAAADQETREPTLAAPVLVALDVFVLVLRLTSFADEVCEERTTYLAAPQQATADQELREPMLAALALALAPVALDVLVVLVLRLTSFAEEVREEGTTILAAPQQTAADQQPREPTSPCPAPSSPNPSSPSSLSSSDAPRSRRR